MPTKITFIFKDDSRQKLQERATRLTRTEAPFRIDGVGLSVQFLRGVFSRASFCLPAFYYFLGAASSRSEASKEDYPSKVARSYSDFSDLNTLTLSCRKIFDHSIKNELTGANFAKSSDEVLEEHADYWSKISDQNRDDALKALYFLRRFFRECSKTSTQLLQSQGQLQKRIGLLKQHADRFAAHLTLDDYAIDLIDLAHFTAATVLVGEIIRSFDSKSLGPAYFEEVDLAAYRTAKRIFPNIASFQIFSRWNLAQQAQLYWKWDEADGINMLLNQIQHAIGGDPKSDA